METPFILASAAQSADTSSVMNFNELVVALTWLAFLIAFVVLGKLLWKPILRYLESREEEIRSSLDDAAAARKAAEEADAKAAQTIADAERDARAQADSIAAATRKDLSSPVFPTQDNDEVTDSNSNVSLIMLLGLLPVC